MNDGRTIRRTLPLATVAVAAFALGLIALLDALNFAREQGELIAARRDGTAAELRETVEAGLHLGMTLDQLSGATELSTRLMRRSVDLVRVERLDAAGVVRHSTAAGREQARDDGAPPPEGFRDLRRPLVHNFGEPAGAVTLRFSDRTADAARSRVDQTLLFAFLAHLALIAAVCGWHAARLARRVEAGEDAMAGGRALLLPAAVLVLAAGSLSWFALYAVEQELLPEVTSGVLLVSDSVTGAFERAARAGAPLARLRGAGEFLRDSLARHRDLRYLVLRDSAGATILAQGEPPPPPPSAESRPPGPPQFRPAGSHLDLALPIRAAEEGEGARRTLATLHAGVARDFVAARQRALALDILTVLCIALLAGYELFRFLLRERSAALPGPGLARLPLFLVVFSDALCLPFLPALASRLAGEGGLSAGAPVSAFMLAWAVAMPLSGTLSDRYGRTAVLVPAAFALALAHALSAAAGSFAALLFARTVSGAAFGAVFLTVQGFMTDRAPAGGRAAALALLQAGYFSGILCGSAIGGIVADRIGVTGAFSLAAALSALAALLARGFLAPAERSARARQGSPASPAADAAAPEIAPARGEPAAAPAAPAAPLANPRFLLLVVLSAIPAKFVLAAFYYTLVPLSLARAGMARADIGRVMIGYALLQVLLAPLFARLAKGVVLQRRFVVAGGLLGGAALLLAGARGDALAIAAAVLALGLAHALSVSPQLAMLPAICGGGERLGLATGVFRLLERLGGVAGPVAAGLLVAGFEHAGAIGVVGAFVFVATVLWALLDPLLERRAAAKGVAA